MPIQPQSLLCALCVCNFATDLEEVLSIEYDKSKFVGKHVTDEERKKHDLPEKEKKDDDGHSDEL